MTTTLMQMVSIVVQSSVTSAMRMPPAAKIWLATFGFGPIWGIACARFSSKRLTAIAVMSADIEVPFLRTGRYAISSVDMPTSAQTKIARKTETQIGRPRETITGMVKIIV